MLQDRAEAAAQTIDAQLTGIIRSVQFCASSPNLLVSLDLPALREECGRYSELLGAWTVVVETGKTHRQLMNTRSGSDDALPVYPREEEFRSLLELEMRSRESDEAGIAELFTGRVYPDGVVTAGMAAKLPDGRDVMVYTGVAANDFSRLLAQVLPTAFGNLSLIDNSMKIVARTGNIEKELIDTSSILPLSTMGSGETDTIEKQPDPGNTSKLWDVANAPLKSAPGWIVSAAIERGAGSFSYQATLAPIFMLLGGFFASLLLFWLSYERERAEAALTAASMAAESAQRLHQAKSRILENISHEIRTPLIALSGALEVSSKALDANLKMKNNIIAAKRLSDHLLYLIDDILELGVLRSGSVHLRSDEIELREFLEDLVLIHRDMASRKKIQLALDVDQKAPATVRTDKKRLYQVFTNLITNAIKFSESGGITVKVELRGGTEVTADLLFSVRDMGIGIESCQIPLIFEEFGRLETEMLFGEQGAGLGIPVCQRILTAMGSSLEVESEVGKGSNFYFTLSLPVVSRPANHETARKLTSTTILLVEDQAFIREVMTRQLIAEGARVIATENGKAALDALSVVSVDLILLDVHMPELDAFQTLDRLKETLPPIVCPIFIITANNHNEVFVKKLLAAGADGILCKPVTPEDLVNALDSLCL